MALNILQISDIHIGESNYDSLNNLVTYIKIALKGKGIIDTILVSGDIFNQDTLDSSKDPDEIEKGINAAARFFNLLVSQINKSNDSKITKEDVLFVPGNHECNQSMSGKGATKEFERYIQFLEKYYEKDIPSFYDKTHLSLVKDYIDQKIALVGFNSAFYTKGKSSAEISIGQIYDMQEKLDSIKNIDEYAVIVMLHHHIYPIDEKKLEDNDDRYLRNYEELFNSLEKYNLVGVLHGHKHRCKNKTAIYTPELEKPNKVTNVLGCASLASSTVENNGLNLIRIYGKDHDLDLEYTEFKTEVNSFKQKPTIVLPIKGDEKIELGLLTELKKVDDTCVKEYLSLSKTDAETPAKELMEMLNQTVGKLEEPCKRIGANNKIPLYLFLPMHFRSGKHNKSIHLDSFKKYAQKYLLEDFNETQIDAILALLLADSLYDMKMLFNRLIDLQGKKRQLSDKQKEYVRFLMVSTFLCENYIVMRAKYREFFQLQLSRKTNLNIIYNNIHEDIAASAIKLVLDEEKRAIKVAVECNTANSHKLVTLIIQEFEIELSEFENEFTNIGFKIYYIKPKFSSVEKGSETLINSYSFEAYMPTLIPLLIGENIYKQPEVFARELIQNSIDAIILRNKVPKYHTKEKGRIIIKFGNENGERYFEIKDNGTGMSKHNLERYFTSIGRSFYSSKDFDDLKTNYAPISKFGIGMLSCFLVGRRIDVFTKFCTKIEGKSQSFKMQIPNYDGCFFIEPNNSCDTGTRIRVYEKPDKESLDDTKIVNYIKRTIMNPTVDIKIEQKCKIDRNQHLNDLVERTKEQHLLFPIGIDVRQNDNGLDFCVNDLDMNRFRDDADYRYNNRHGIFIYKPDNDLYSSGSIYFNASGIFVEEGQISVEFIGGYFDAYINLPSSLIQIDVSRDFIKSIDKWDKIILEAENCFEQQTQKYLKSDNSNTIPLFILSHLGEKEDQVMFYSINERKNSFAIRINKQKQTLDKRLIKILSKVIDIFSLNSDIKTVYNKLSKEIKDIMIDLIMCTEIKSSSLLTNDISISFLLASINKLKNTNLTTNADENRVIDAIKRISNKNGKALYRWNRNGRALRPFPSLFSRTIEEGLLAYSEDIDRMKDFVRRISRDSYLFNKEEKLKFVNNLYNLAENQKIDMASVYGVLYAIMFDELYNTIYKYITKQDQIRISVSDSFYISSITAFLWITEISTLIYSKNDYEKGVVVSLQPLIEASKMMEEN